MNYSPHSWKTHWLNSWQLKERGWSDTAIKKFLQEPDLLTKVPRRPCPVKWYRQERVEQIEANSEEFRRWRQRVRARQLRKQNAECNPESTTLLGSSLSLI